MEALGVALALVFLYGVYYAVRVGVRDGIKDALKDRDVQVRAPESDR